MTAASEIASIRDRLSRIEDDVEAARERLDFTPERIANVYGDLTRLEGLVNVGPDPDPDPDPEPPDPDPDPDPEPPPPGRPARQWIIDNAGLAVPVSSLTPSGSLVISRPGAVVENLDVNGSINIRADNVTIRNVRVRGSAGRSLVGTDREGAAGTYQFRGTTIEHCDVEVTGSALGGIGYLGLGSTVRHCHVHGQEADGIKIEEGISASRPSLYEYNYIHMTKAPGSGKHLDGMQASADSHWIVRYSVIDMPASAGGNAAILAQCWNGASNSHETGWDIIGNYLRGGNFTLYTSGGKDTKPNYSTPTDVRVIDNSFEGAFRYGNWRNHVRPSDLTAYGNTGL